MLRLAHKFVTKKLNFFGRGQHPEIVKLHAHHALEIRQTINAGCPVIVADNVAEFYWNSPQMCWDLSQDFPNIAPPFPRMFIEWMQPRHGSTIEGTGVIDTYGVGLFGCSVIAEELVEGRLDRVVATMESNGHFDIAQQMRKTCDGARWVLLFSVGMTINGDPGVHPARYLAAVGPDGRCVGTHFMAHQRTISMLRSDPKIKSPEAILQTLHVPFLTISFMHCKNVVMTDSTQQVAPTEKWMRRSGVRPIKYHVLDINPMKEVLRSEGGVSHNGVQKALHICRGHFKTYTEDKPLFGHTVGTVWCPSHARGDIKHGAVVKDYRVNEPQEQPQC